jgi:hypothetical protein
MDGTQNVRVCPIARLVPPACTALMPNLIRIGTSGLLHISGSSPPSMGAGGDSLGHVPGMNSTSRNMSYLFDTRFLYDQFFRPLKAQSHLFMNPRQSGVDLCTLI